MDEREVKPDLDEGLALRSSASLPDRHIYGRLSASPCCQARGICGGAEPAVPIRRLLEHNDAFSPEDVQVLLGVFDDTLRALNLTDRERPLTMMVAKLIIAFAKEGERDPDRLRDLVMNSLRPE